MYVKHRHRLAAASLVASMAALSLLVVMGQTRIDTVSPAFGPPGTKVTLRGHGLLNPDPEDARSQWFQGVSNERPPGRVEFGGAAAIVTLWQDDIISVVVPQGANDGPIRIVLDGAGVIAQWESFDVYYDTRHGAAERTQPQAERRDEPAPRSNEPGLPSNPVAGAEPTRRDKEGLVTSASRPGSLERGLIEAFLIQGVEAFLRGEFARVEDYLTRYLQGSGPERGRAYFYRGAARCGLYYLSGGEDQALLNSAIEDFRQVAKLKPTFRPPRELISPKILRLFEQAR